MAQEILQSLKSRVLVCDGAMGTELINRGLEPGSCPELWNVDRADEVAAIHRAYVDAGADIILTNTFGANRWKLEAYGLGTQVERLNAAGVDAARAGAGPRVFVAGDIGPTGRFVAPLGTDPREAFVEVFAEQAGALAKAGVDALILETFSSLDEITAALEGAKRFGLPVIASMSFAGTPDGTFRTMMGHDVKSCAKSLESAGADVVGANCGSGPDQYAGIARALRKATKLPILLEPNAGMPELVAGKTVFPMSASEFAGYVPAYLSAGARIVGGCCGTTPEHIAAVRRAVHASR